jgi:hypothetical protein
LDATPPPGQVPLTTPAVSPEGTVVMAGHCFSVQVGAVGQLPLASQLIGFVPPTSYPFAVQPTYAQLWSDEGAPPGQLPLATPAVVVEGEVVMAGHVAQDGGAGQLPLASQVMSFAPVPGTIE